ncbi:MAG: hypothetical protein ACRD3T_21105, partial [Terriglobia bacterium]
MSGTLSVPYGRAPALWRFAEYNGNCEGQAVNMPTAVDAVTYLNCHHVGGLGGGQYEASPNPLYASSPPAAVTVTGSGFSTTYGMPRVEYYYNDGTYVGEEVATQATSTWISGPPPSNLSSLPSGVYVGAIQNETEGGGWAIIGVADVNVVTTNPPHIGGGGGGGGGGG